MVFGPDGITPNSGLTGPNNTNTIYIYIYIYRVKERKRENLYNGHHDFFICFFDHLSITSDRMNV